MQQRAMPPAGFKPAIPASERLQIHALHHTATEIGFLTPTVTQISCLGELNKESQQVSSYVGHPWVVFV
jgi:hypothetical protein